MSTVRANAILDASGGNTATINTYTPTESNMGGKNRIINGDMRIDQRNAGASVTPTGNAYTIDRWAAGMSQASKFSVQRSTTAPTGFINSALITSTSAYSVTSSDRFAFSQFIEGLNCADLGWGTASAKTITLSFQVRSSLTGTFGGSLQNDSATRSYPFTYTISAANTWETKTVTIAGDTTGTWLTDTGIGIIVRFSLGTGSTYSGTAGAWAAADYRSVTGAVSVVGTNAATWYITGAQLEVGSVATPFERRDYGRELMFCQRYYQKFTATAGGQVFGSGMMNTTTTSRNFIPFLVPLRTNPTALEQSGTAGDYAIFHGGTVTTCSAVPGFVAATVNGATFEATIASGGTAGNGSLFRAATASAYLGWSAEL
jgi:hypothetical protein